MGTTASLINLMTHPVKSRLYLLLKLPSAFFSGVRVRVLRETDCSVSVPYRWFSRNPFRSTYFACLSMAAEMSTGLLALAHTYKREPSVSTLVVKIEGVFMKKATGLSTFSCTQGMELKQVVENAIETGKAQTFQARSIGVNKRNEVVAEFFVTWSFKARA